MGKKIIILFFQIFLISLVQAGINRPTRDALESINAEDVRRHIDFLASDSLKGRDTPSPELDIAAHYIADEFQRYGLEPLGDNYFQKFYLNLVRLGKENYLSLLDKNGEVQFKIKKEFMPYEFTANKSVEGVLVFAGYGITAPEYNYDDYANLDVKGKIVLVLKHEPLEKDSSSVFDGVKLTDYAKIKEKVENAISHGAIGMLIVTDPLHHRSLRPRGFPWPSLYKNIPNDALPYTLALLEEKKIPVVQVGKKFINRVFGNVDSLKAIQKHIDENFAPDSFLIPNVKIKLKTSTEIESYTTQNVVAYLEGADPRLKNQAVIIGAHYDHVGYKKGPHKPGEDYIYNGADDNASGTAGLLEIAQAFSVAPRPKRSVIFIAFAGEELGLYGSRVYVEQPLWPLKNTVAMLNMDMIGRNEGDKVTIVGFKRSPDLNQINIEENRYVGMKLQYNGEQFFMRSDQYNFARKGIPVLFYNTGEHPDYHKVTDNPDKINTGKVAMIARLVFRTAWRAANTDQKFRLIKIK
ncbi:MAG: M20/M25/M40 family metallo-hydrolase [Calditrichaeota bacterium]|nr:MAG: M20/M25/M40 family metallo-hydrolase [Calditrichota bacterium]